MNNINSIYPSPRQQEVAYRYTAESNASANDEIDLRELWNILWQGKLLIIAITAVFAMGSVFYVLSLPNIYQSTTLLTPSEDSQGGGISRMAGKLSGLASLAGINIGKGGSNKIAIALEVIQSRQFITEFVERHGLLPQLMAVEAWDRPHNMLVFDPELYSAAQSKWVRDVEPPKAPEPSAWEAYKAFMKILTVSEDMETGFVTVSLEHQSPYVAQRWVSLLVSDLNGAMKEKDVTEAERSIDYLKKQLNQVSLAEMRTIFYELIEEQTKIIMLAQVREEYIFKTIDKPVVPQEKAKPSRALICILGTMLGGMLAVMFVFGRHFVGGARDGNE